MEKKQLLETLEQLHRELAQAERVDPDTLAELRAQIADIERLLDQRDNAPADEVEPVSSGLKDLLLKFEAEHPQLSAAIGRVADSLAAMGF